jgi:hypothetical protein
MQHGSHLAWTVSAFPSSIRPQKLTSETSDRSAIVPFNQGKKAGLWPDHVQVSEKYGGGFPANVEGLHHIHCLVIALRTS